MVLDAGNPPAMLLLGPDALQTYRATLADRLGEADSWATLTASTSFEGV